MQILLDFLRRYNYIFLFVVLEIVSRTLLFRVNDYQGSVWLTAAGEVLHPVDRLFEITEAGAPDAEGHRTYLLRKSPDVTNAELLRHLAAQVEPIAFAEHLPTMRDIFVRTVGANLSTSSVPDHE